MNAAEARKLSEQNSSKLIESCFKKSVNNIDDLIKATSKIGEFSVRSNLTFSSNIRDAIINRLVVHYQDLGYHVEVNSLPLSKSISISWGEKEDPTSCN
ncbi:hypothetical protein [Heyndrickxia sporothermodurans]|uniref:hypothetical protein n=1 Tax=Heyndrickxia sporothermodurans TaxID=46224 RepID=UPI002E1E4CBA|nr:hypothetical protein [Heyndrickxia sporothermodurans]MED3697401.1 hypothetical protein [Heyndrickxia sporothermodurans]